MKSALLLLLAAATAIAQEKPQEPAFFSETVEVHVVNVDVVVTDKSGKPVPALTKDDFELYANGQKQEISYFIELKDEAAPATAPAPAGAPAPAPAAAPPQDSRPRKILFFLDASTLQAFNRNRVIKPMKEFLHKVVRPGDQVMLVSWNNSLTLDVPITGSVELIEKKLDEMSKTTTVGQMADVERRMAEKEIRDIPLDYKSRVPPEIPPIQLGLQVAELYGNKVLHQLHGRVEALRSVIAAMRGVEGRKVLVMVTENLTDNPALPIFQYLEAHKDEYSGGNSVNFYQESQSYTDRSIIQLLSDAANSSGVTFYAIDAGGLGGAASDLSPEVNSGYTSGGVSVVTSEEKLAALRAIAEHTGGAALTGSNNFTLGFNTIANDLTTYYSLGYKAGAEKTDVVRSIQVKLKRKGLNVRTRQQFVEKTVASEMSDAVAANLFYPIQKNELNITMTTGLAVPGAEKRVVPIELKIPMSALTLIPQGEDLVGSFSTFTAFRRDDGAVSEIKQQQHQLRFPAESLKRRKEVTLKLDLTVDPKTEGVSIGVMDDASHTTGFATAVLPTSS